MDKFMYWIQDHFYVVLSVVVIFSVIFLWFFPHKWPFFVGGACIGLISGILSR